jgi:hypothetical protein
MQDYLEDFSEVSKPKFDWITTIIYLFVSGFFFYFGYEYFMLGKLNGNPKMYFESCMKYSLAVWFLAFSVFKVIIYFRFDPKSSNIKQLNIK